MRSIAFLLLRLTVGGLIAGHGAQKLFGWFGGQGLRRTAGWMESIRLKPGTAWARLAGGSEFFGGLLTALGFLNPLGPIAAAGAMLMAWAKVHLGKPIWATKGGAELPLVNLTALAAFTVAGPGRLSIDRLLGIRISRAVAVMAMAATAVGVYVGARREIEAGTSDLAEADEQVEGDPSPSDDATASIESAGGAMDEGGSERRDEGDERRTGAERAAHAGVAASTGMMGGELDDTYRVGESGADAGTSMGSGSGLGSETPESDL
jgi:putative oxidoreductase